MNYNYVNKGATMVKDSRAYLYENAALDVLAQCEGKTGKQLVKGGWEFWLSAALVHERFLTTETRERLVKQLDLADNQLRGYFHD